MNYEQKYKEALERARMYHTGGSICDAHMAEVIFPELKESEDERIRKALIDLFSNNAKKDWRDIPTEKIIAWLKKQNKKLDADKVIEWLNNNWWYSNQNQNTKLEQIEKFKKDFDIIKKLKYYD